MKNPLLVVVVSVFLTAAVYSVGYFSGFKVKESRHLEYVKAVQEEVQKKEKFRLSEIERIQGEYRDKISDIEHQRNLADDSSNRLRQEVYRLRNSTPKCEGSGSSVNLLAELSGRLNEASGELAEYADRLRAAELACSEYVKSLTSSNRR